MTVCIIYMCDHGSDLACPSMYMLFFPFYTAPHCSAQGECIGIAHFGFWCVYHTSTGVQVTLALVCFPHLNWCATWLVCLAHPHISSALAACSITIIQKSTTSTKFAQIKIKWWSALILYTQISNAWQLKNVSRYFLTRFDCCANQQCMTVQKCFKRFPYKVYCCTNQQCITESNLVSKLTTDPRTFTGSLNKAISINE